MTSDIKALTPAVCPHCKKDIVIQFVAPTPEMKAVVTIEQLAQAKTEVVQKVSTLQLSEKDLKIVLAYVEAPETVLAPSDVDEIIENIKNEYGISKKDPVK